MYVCTCVCFYNSCMHFFKYMKFKFTTNLFKKKTIQFYENKYVFFHFGTKCKFILKNKSFEFYKKINLHNFCNFFSIVTKANFRTFCK